MKKAQGISVNVIIIAAIALLVLVVLSVIFIGRMGGWGESTNDCENNGGSCAQQYCTEGVTTKHPTWSCKNAASQINRENACCIPLQT